MDKALLLDAAIAFSESDLTSNTQGRQQAVRQFNALLQQAKDLYPNRPDIEAMEAYDDVRYVAAPDFIDVSKRLRASLELRRPGTITELVNAIQLPSDAPQFLEIDLEEFKAAVAVGLKKSCLLLAGSLAESLLLTRHPDTSEKGPGLARLLDIAKAQRLFGRDTLRQLETLNDYRDLIHSRAGPRNRIQLNEARVEQCVQAVRLLCAELQDTDVHFD